MICALSGGVDSTVAATLVHQVLGDRLHCVFVDNGLLRYKVCRWLLLAIRTINNLAVSKDISLLLTSLKGESLPGSWNAPESTGNHSHVDSNVQEAERVMDTFKNHLHLPVTMIDHTEVMLARLKVRICTSECSPAATSTQTNLEAFDCQCRG